MPRISRLEQLAATHGVSGEELLTRTLKDTQSIEGTADRLGLYPESVRRAMKKYHLRLKRTTDVVKEHPQHTALRRPSAERPLK